MSFSAKQEFRIPRHIVQPSGVNIEAISANKTLTNRDSQYQSLDAQSGGLECILPDEKDGAMFVINAQGNAITVKDGAGNTIKALSLGEGGMFCCDGTNWKQFL